MESVIKNLYIRLAGKNNSEAPIVEQDALNIMFMLRTEQESYPQLKFNFAANQKTYDDEENIFRFIVKYRV